MPKINPSSPNSEKIIPDPKPQTKEFRWPPDIASHMRKITDKRERWEGLYKDILEIKLTLQGLSTQLNHLNLRLDSLHKEERNDD